jgi:nitrous oxidase accessory protein NosD
VSRSIAHSRSSTRAVVTSSDSPGAKSALDLDVLRAERVLNDRCRELEHVQWPERGQRIEIFRGRDADFHGNTSLSRQCG